jgi:hypothetical protein
MSARRIVPVGCSLVVATLLLAAPSHAVKPPKPANFDAEPVAGSTTQIRLSWSDVPNETHYVVQARTWNGSFTPLAPNLPANTTSVVVSNFSGLLLFRVSAENADGATLSDADAVNVNVAPFPCAETATNLCINGDRFYVDAFFRIPSQVGQAGAVPIPSAPDSGVLHFFSPSNLEMLIKVLDGCGPNDRYWVFYAATTNVEFAVRVADTHTGRVRTYYNPLNRPAPPVQDTSAFATCP